jgi:hypothetical protein
MMDNLTREHVTLIGAAFKKLARAMGLDAEVILEEQNAGRSFERDSVRVLFVLRTSTGTRRGILELGREVVDFADSTTAASHIVNQLLTESTYVSREFQIANSLRYLEKVDQHGNKRF